jgi:23S rRNA (uracil1939-C5)-methyltransferase
MAREDEWLLIESLDGDAHGVARDSNGKVVFVDGALPGEQVRVRVVRRKNQWERGTLSELGRESAQRVRPACEHFGLHAGACGGCRMQHMHVTAQVAVKQRVLEDNLWHLGRVRPDRLLRPVEGPAWRYRHRARLSVRYVSKKGGVLVGFHERQSSYVADMRTCQVLPPAVSGLLMPLRELIGSMQARDRLPQIELAMGEAQTVFVLRHLGSLVEGDVAKLRAFAKCHRVQWWLQPEGPHSAHALDDLDAGPAYVLPEFDLRFVYRPTEFTQVNPHTNEVLVGRAVRLLDPQIHERVIDWFCGLGNFSLPLATRAASVLGVEGSPSLVERARENAQRNGLAGRARFAVADLFACNVQALLGHGSADRWLVDPPREGALALVMALVESRNTGGSAWRAPQRIVYVSCNPPTLARDAGLLVHQAGYRCTAAGVVNMFPHTAHVESIAVFDAGAVG